MVCESLKILKLSAYSQWYIYVGFEHRTPLPLFPNKGQRQKVWANIKTKHYYENISERNSSFFKRYIRYNLPAVYHTWEFTLFFVTENKSLHFTQLWIKLKSLETINFLFLIKIDIHEKLQKSNKSTRIFSMLYKYFPTINHNTVTLQYSSPGFCKCKGT